MSTCTQSRLVLKLTTTLLCIITPFAYSKPPSMTQQQITTLVSKHFGPKVRTDISSGEEKWMPRYIWVEFTRGSSPVLVIPIHVDGAKGTLNARSIKAITEDGYEISPDETIGSNCLALAFLHDLPSVKAREDKRQSLKPSATLLPVECCHAENLYPSDDAGTRRRDDDA